MLHAEVPWRARRARLVVLRQVENIVVMLFGVCNQAVGLLESEKDDIAPTEANLSLIYSNRPDTR